MKEMLEYSCVVTHSGGFQASVRMLITEGSFSPLVNTPRVYHSYTGKVSNLKKAAEQSAAEEALSESVHKSEPEVIEVDLSRVGGSTAAPAATVTTLKSKSTDDSKSKNSFKCISFP